MSDIMLNVFDPSKEEFLSHMKHFLLHISSCIEYIYIFFFPNFSVFFFLWVPPKQPDQPQSFPEC